MATIAIHNDDLNYMPELLDSFGYSVGGLSSELDNFKKKCSKVNQSICNLEDAINLISSSTQIQSEKWDSIRGIYSNVEDFAVEVRDIDSRVAEKINDSKDDFYEEYSYLRPSSEKNWLENAGDNLNKFFDWCAENWDNICNVIKAVVAIVAIVAVSIATFGIGTVLIVAAVGAVVNIVSKLVVDLTFLAITGEWPGTIESYARAFLSGVVGGLLTLSLNPVLASATNNYIMTLFGEGLDSLTGKKKRTGWEVQMDAITKAETGAITSLVFSTLSDTLGQKLSEKFDIFSRFSGDNSYGAAYKQAIDALKTGDKSFLNWGTFGNGVASKLFGKIIPSLHEIISTPIKKFPIEGTAVHPIQGINILPIAAY